MALSIHQLDLITDIQCNADEIADTKIELAIAELTPEGRELLAQQCRESIQRQKGILTLLKAGN